MELKTAFLIHAVVSGLFCVPTIVLGWKGFIGLMSDGAITKPDDFLTGLIGVDFMKNLLITWVAFQMSSCKDAATQKSVALSMIGMALGCGYSCVSYPMQGHFMGIPPPAMIYIGSVMGAYGIAFATGSATGGSSKKK